MALVEFVNCGDCECNFCSRNHSCPKTDMMEEPCISCEGAPPYAPWDCDGKLHEFDCDEKKSTIKSIK